MNPEKTPKKKIDTQRIHALEFYELNEFDEEGRC